MYLLWICKHIGMSIDELLRLKQITGLASLFQNRDFSDSWEAEEGEEIEEGQKVVDEEEEGELSEE